MLFRRGTSSTSASLSCNHGSSFASQPGDEPLAAAADLHATQVADFRFNAVNIGSGGNVKSDFDELRIGTTFDAVAPRRTDGD